MALNNLWGKLGAFSRNVLVPSNVIYKSFDADPLVSDKMSRAISRWYGTLDDLCDSVMDAIDEILGEGMSDQILGMKEGYTFWDACDVFKYTTDEINTAMRGVAASYASKPPITPVNRAQRRAKHKRHGA